MRKKTFAKQISVCGKKQKTLIFKNIPSLNLIASRQIGKLVVAYSVQMFAIVFN